VNVLRYRKPQIFCIDEAQHITYAVQEKRLAAHLDLIKWIALDSRRPVLLVGTYELLAFSRLSGQLGRRMNHIPFAPYDWVREDQRQSFRLALRAFVTKLPARLSIDAVSDEGVDDVSDGHFRFLFAGSARSRAS
jgi:hypothetical protein